MLPVRVRTVLGPPVVAVAAAIAEAEAEAAGIVTVRVDGANDTNLVQRYT